MIHLQSDHLLVIVVPEEGAEIRFLGRPGGENALFWANWAAPLPARGSMTYGDSQLDWLSRYRGGWQELFPNAGDECTVLGVPLPFHGEVSSAQWEVVRQCETELVVRTAARLPLTIERRMVVDGRALRIEESISNESDLVVPFVWGHHPAFHAGAGARIDLPDATIRFIRDRTNPAGSLATDAAWPFVHALDGGTLDLSRVPEGVVDRYTCLTDLAAPWVALRDVDREVGVGLAWDPAALPCLWLWQQIGGTGFPWYGRASITAMEPSTAWPDDGLVHAIERGQAHQLGPGASMDAWVTAVLFDPDERPVTFVDQSGAVMFTSGPG